MEKRGISLAVHNTTGLRTEATWKLQIMQRPQGESSVYSHPFPTTAYGIS
jgi:hypothetical protein